jgi:precorrin-2 dehydrogenase/sirohydrochlorin ferrochelatase
LRFLPEDYMKPYPIMMILQSKPVIVIGGGRVAARKVPHLLECGAQVTIVSPELVHDLKELTRQGLVQWIQKEFDAGLFDRFPSPVLVFGTTDRREVNVAIYEAATERGIPCNIADVPDLCSFIVPGTVRQGDMTIAVSTGGASPALTRRIREDLQERFGPEYCLMTRLMAGLRREILSLGATSQENKPLFMSIVDSDLLDALRARDRDRAARTLARVLPAEIDPMEALERAIDDTWGEGTDQWT